MGTCTLPYKVHFGSAKFNKGWDYKCMAVRRSFAPLQGAHKLLVCIHKRFLLHPLIRDRLYTFSTVPLQVPVTKEERGTVQDLSSQNSECNNQCIPRLFYILACFTPVVNKSYNDPCYYCVCCAVLACRM